MNVNTTIIVAMAGLRIFIIQFTKKIPARNGRDLLTKISGQFMRNSEAQSIHKPPGGRLFF